MPNTRAVPVALLFFFVVSAAAMAGGPFLDLSLDEALARAKAEKKLVFIDFFATWCGPCKQLDATTFADEKVVAWLGEHTVPVKIDVDKVKEIAKRFQVSAMPTLVFLSADGTELDRIRGYRDGEAFLTAARAVAEHPEMDAVARAREELASGNWPEALARQKLGTALLLNGEKEEALAEYRKALGSLGTDMMSDRCRMQLIGDICGMAGDHPPAAEVLAARRETLVKKLEGGDGDSSDVEQITAIDAGLDQKEKSFELYNRLSETGGMSADVLGGFSRACRDVMLERRDYAALDAADSRGLTMTLLQIESIRRQRKIVAGDFSDVPEQYSGELRQRFGGMSEEQKADFLSSTEQYTVKRAAEAYEVARGLGKTTDAMVIAEKLLELCPTAEAHHALAAHALRSGKPAEADLGYAGKAVELDRGEHQEYVLTRYELMEHFNRAAAVPPGPAPSTAIDSTGAARLVRLQ
jgi:thiol-disulfide isomerase/thioredoxin